MVNLKSDFERILMESYFRNFKENEQIKKKKIKLKYCVSIHLMRIFWILYISLANIRLEKLLSLIRLCVTPSFRHDIKLY